MDNLPPPYLPVVDAQGEMSVAEIAPVIGDYDVLDIRVWQMPSLIVIGTIVPADVDAVVVFGFLLLFPGFKRRDGMSFLKRMVFVVFARGVGVFIVAGEGKEKHTTVFLLGIVHPCRNKLNLHLLGILVLTDDATSKEIDRLQTAFILEINSISQKIAYTIS